MWFRKKNRCIDCGFLEPHYWPGEATPEFRQSIQNTKEPIKVNNDLQSNYLLCHRRALSDYITDIATMLEERDCKYFYPYKRGCSPSQHLQMQDNEKRDLLNWRRDIITAAIFTILGAILTLLAIWITNR